MRGGRGGTRSSSPEQKAARERKVIKEVRQTDVLLSSRAVCHFERAFNGSSSACVFSLSLSFSLFSVERVFVLCLIFVRKWYVENKMRQTKEPLRKQYLISVYLYDDA